MRDGPSRFVLPDFRNETRHLRATYVTRAIIVNAQDGERPARGESASRDGSSRRKAADTDHTALRTAERERDAAAASRDRFSFLAEVSRCLADSLDYEETLTTVAGMSLPYLGAWCIVDVAEDGYPSGPKVEGGIRRLTVQHPDPAKRAIARELQDRYPPSPDDLIGSAKVIRTGRPEMVFDVPPSALAASARDPEHLELLRSLGVQAYIIAPMVARGRTLGAITFVTAESGRRFGELDVLMAEDIARRSAMAVDNARLHREAITLREAAEDALAEAEELASELEVSRDEADEARTETSRSAARLQALAAALSVASTEEEVAEAVVTHATEVFGAVGVVIARVSPDEVFLEILSAGAMPSDIRQEWARFPISAPVPLADVARTGRELFLESPAAWIERYPDMQPLLEATGHSANAVVPLVVEGRVLGVLGAAFDSPRTFDEDDRSLALSVGQQCAQALERARLLDAERRARNDAEVARAAAEKANQAKAEFLAAMSHELRTPLNAIGGYAQLIEMGIHGPVTDAQQEALSRIDLAQRHLLRLVNDVLNFARIQAGHLEYDVQPMQLAEVVRAVEPMLSPQMQAKRLAYEVAVPADCMVHADRSKLTQVLVNLLSNAVKFTPPGGRITVDSPKRGDGSGDAHTVFLRVGDTGVGIPRDKLQDIFEPFVQVDATPKGRKGGAGLGLAISRDLTRGMGGDIRVRSVVGEGTTFTVALPRA